MRSQRSTYAFAKMESAGDDYIFFDNRDGGITCPESLCVSLCSRHYGIGGDGIVLIEESSAADAKMRIFNIDGSEGKMAGNAIRCVAKFLFDKGIVKKEKMRIETASGIKAVTVFVSNNLVTSATVDMGAASFALGDLPALLPCEEAVDYPAEIAGAEYRITCVSMGNPHAIVYMDDIDHLDIEKIGPAFENHVAFPDRVNTEFVEVIDEHTVKMRVWERGSGETLACGTGACAVAVASVLNGHVDGDSPVTVKLLGGDLQIFWNRQENLVYMTGPAATVFDGEIDVSFLK